MAIQFGDTFNDRGEVLTYLLSELMLKKKIQKLKMCCQILPPIFLGNVEFRKHTANSKTATQRQNRQTWTKRRKLHHVAGSLQVVNHLLLGDEMCGLVDQRHKRVEFVWPIVEQVVGVFGPLKVYDAGQSVDLGIDGFVYDEAGEELLWFLLKYD